MITFGLSAFLKLANSTPAEQRSLVRERLLPSEAYDFHRALRLRIRQYVRDGVPLADVVKSVDSIRNEAERKAMRIGLRRLARWLEETPRPVLSFDAVTFESPNEVFAVRFSPDFGLQIGDRATAVHIWNTKKPSLAWEPTYAVLSLLLPLYRGLSGSPTDIAVYSLPVERLFQLSAATDHTEIAAWLVGRIERLFEDIADELRIPTPGKGAPPPAPLA